MTGQAPTKTDWFPATTVKPGPEEIYALRAVTPAGSTTTESACDL